MKNILLVRVGVSIQNLWCHGHRRCDCHRYVQSLSGDSEVYTVFNCYLLWKLNNKL